MKKTLYGLLAVFVLVGATPALAQLPGIELEPYIGVYVPTQDIVKDDILGVTGSQKEGLVVGARLTFWLAGPFGIEGNFTYAFSDGEEDDGTTVTEESAAVWMGDGRLIWKVLPGPLGIHLTGGVAVIGRSGDAYDEVTEGKTDFGGVLGAGLRVKLPGVFAIRGDVDVFGYSAKIEDADSQFQADVVASAGLVIGLGG